MTDTKKHPAKVSDIVKRYGLDLPGEVTGFVSGSKCLGSDDARRIPINCPSTEEHLFDLVESDAQSVSAAVEAARNAFDETRWPRLPHAERKKILGRVRDAIDAHREELSALLTLEVGLPINRVSDVHMPRAIENFDFFLEVAGTISGETYSQTGKYLSVVTREPCGVAALVAPWNAPISLLSMKMAAALALGNTCVVKASEYAPYSIYRFVEIMHEAGLPPGLVNLVNGRGHSTGRQLVENPGVDVIGFVGGTQTGAEIMKSAAAGIRKVGLELGGKSANIVFESADIEKAIDGSLLAILSNNGQQCLAGSRVFLQRGIAEEFIEKFTRRMAAVKVGDPFEATTDIGPLAYAKHRDRFLSYVQIALDEDAELLIGGNRHPDFDYGYFIEPTAVRSDDNRSRFCQEEIFGPFVTLLTFDSEDEAIALSNDSDFGLVCYVWSENLTTVMNLSRNIKAGTVWVNTPMARDLRAPFGGYKQSGIGRDGIHGSTDLFTEEKTTMIPAEPLAFRRLGLSKEE